MIRPTPDCLSDLRIDRMLAGDLNADEQARARGHLTGCATCAARVTALEAAHAATPPAMDLETIRRLAAPARRSWGKLWPSLGLALAAGAAAVVLAARPAGPETGNDATRTKGRARLGLFIKHGDAVRRGGPGEEVSPGDLARFVVSTPRPAHVAIVGVDAHGAASLYFPMAGASDSVAAGTNVELPRATQLDETIGPETVAAFFCDGPVDLAAVRAHPQDAPAGCTIDRLDWVKVPAR